MRREKYSDRLVVAANQNIKEKKYWLQQLAGESGSTYFPYDYKKTGGEGRREDSLTFEFDPEASRKLMQLANNSDIRLYMILVTTLVALLNKYTRSSDICLGVPIYKQEIQGDFINRFLILRNRFHRQVTFKELLLSVRQTIVEATEHYSYPLEMLLEELNIPLSGSSDPGLFDIAILLETIHDKDYLRPIIHHMNMCFSFSRVENRLEGMVVYNSGLYRQETVAEIIRYFKRLLDLALFMDIDFQVCRQDLLSEEEKKRLLVDFNDTQAGYPETKTLHRLFEEQVERTPHHAALLGESLNPATRGKAAVTYRELNKRADRLAAVLKERGAKPDVLVGIMMARSTEMISAVLAILKSGGAYLPIDPGYPVERIHFILKDSNAGLLLTSYACPAKEKIHFDKETLYVEEEENDPLVKSSGRHDNNRTGCRYPLPGPINIAYTIYTSGTTGKPKGVVIEHRNLVRLFINDRFPFDFGSRDVWTMFHSHCFDFSVWEIFGALLYGGKLVVVPEMVAKDSRQYLKILENQCVTVLNQTPSAFNNLVREELQQERAQLHLRYVIFGGEALQPARLKPWKERYPQTKLVNMFGITETTVHVTYKEISHREIEQNISNIGKPIPTLSTYIMDRHLHLLPIGAVGELCVAGGGVARGYLNRPGLTRERFTGNPFKAGEGLYRSGDLARLSPSGEMVYLGRLDQQVQLRGFRIEMGEIETQLLKHPGIEDAVVVKKNDQEGEDYLCGYIVAEKSLKIARLRDYLGQSLPGYMVPAYFVHLKKIPLTPNGKVDKKALPEPQTIPEEEYAAPEHEIEIQLAEIWAKVLNLERIGIKDNYFNMGGDSIKAVKLLALVNSQLNTDLTIPDLYQNETVEKLAKRVDQQVRIHKKIQLETALDQLEELKTHIRKKKEIPEGIEDFYPMSDIQKGMVFASLLNPGEAIYLDQFSFQVKYRDFDAALFKKAMGLMVKKHPTFRTSFNIADFEEELQMVHRRVCLDVESYDISNLDRTTQENHINDYLENTRKKPFDVSMAPLWRLRTFVLGTVDVAVTWEFHHAVLDGWSNASFATELNNIYMELKSNPGYKPAPLRNSYKTFIADQLLEKKNQHTIAYWRKELQDFKRLDLPQADTKDDAPHMAKKHLCSLGTPFLQQLRDSARHRQVSVKSACFAAYLYMLNMVSFENDLVVGLLTNSRPVCEDGDEILGCFLNTIPFRVKIPSQMTWANYIRLINRKLLEVKKYDRLSLWEISKAVGERTDGRNPIFDTFFNFVDFHVYNRVNPGDVPANKEKDTRSALALKGNERTNLLFDMAVNTTLDIFDILVSYHTAIFSDDDVEQLMGYFRGVLNEFVYEPEHLATKESLLPEDQKQELLHDLNDTAVDYLENKTLHRLFEDRAGATPDHIATLFAEKDIQGCALQTYRNLNERANQLGRMLRERGVGKNSLVGTAVDRSLEMMTAIFAVLKAGGAYLPIDPGFPDQRIQYILADSRTRLLLTRGSIKKRFAHMCGVIDLTDSSLFQGERKNVQASSSPADPAYVTYTSGSTGKPKGVVIEHRPVINFIKGITDAICFKESDTILSLTTLSFDIFVLETILPLVKGAKVVIGNKEEQMDAAAIASTIYREKITIFQVTPSRLQLLVPHKAAAESLKRLTYLLVGGELFPHTLLADVEDITRGNVKIFNLYGPTETTVWSTIKELCGGRSLNIGKPIANTRVYIVNKTGSLQPPGVFGELCIAGDGVARGYLNRPALTGEKFLPYVFTAGPSIQQGRFYKTGDFARWLPDGNLEISGRIDHQVKIRGFRVELGEIESKLLEHDDIKEAAALDWEDETHVKYLCAYVVLQSPASTGSPDKDAVSGLRDFLARDLPDYMVPTYVVLLDKIPLTPNGKVDRKSLPPPESGIIRNEYAAPRNKLEEQMVNIWADVLGIEKEKLGIDDNFFVLGGHSLKATKLLAKLHKELNMQISLAEIFKTPRIRDLCERPGINTVERYADIEAVEKKEFYRVSPGQNRLYILQQLDPGNTVYHIPQVMELDKNPGLEKLSTVFYTLIRRHEGLRTSFRMIDKEVVQQVHDHVDFEIGYEKTAAAETPQELELRARAFMKPFDLAKAPLIRVNLLKTGHRHYLLMMDIHHIIADGLSMTILVNDFLSLYNGKTLKPLPVQYKDFSEWQRTCREKGETGLHETYWLNEFQGDIPRLDLPLDYARPAVQSFAGNTFHFSIDRERTEKLKSLALKEEVTLYMVLLAAFNVLLAKLSGSEDIVIGSPTAGRRHENLAPIIGMFVNTLALRNFPAGNIRFDTFLRDVKTRTLKAFDNQDYPFEDLVENVNIERDTGRNPLFDVVFVLQNMDSPGAGIPGLNLTPLDVQGRTSKFDITFQVIEVEKGLYFTIEYCTKLFRKKTVERFVRYFSQVIISVLEDKKKIISDIGIIEDEERRQLLEDFNQTRSEYPKNKTVHTLFEEQAARVPDNIALVKEERSLTYGELSQQSTRLAAYLEAKGLREEEAVGIMLEPSLEMIVGILGILKAGGAYLAVNPGYPTERKKYLLEDGPARFVLTNENKPDLGSREIINPACPGIYDTLADSRALAETGRFDSPAYIIYTSGSTGKPKGVLVEHRSIVRLVKNTNFVELRDNDRILQTGALEFDASTFEIWGALLNGLRLYLVSKHNILNAGALKETMHKHKITTIWMTSSLFNRMLDAEIDIFSGLKNLLVGGETLSLPHINRLRNTFPHVNVINGYGPTENTTFSTTHLIDREYKKSIPIGKPIANSTAYIVDRYNKPVPRGVSGELCVGGDGLARGYVNNPQLTAEKFPPAGGPTHPTHPLTHSPIYRTGDLVRWLPDGNIEFIGRQDQQIKIRGFRVELGEIETRLLQHSKIKAAMVTAKSHETGDKYLCAYIVPHQKETLSQNLSFAEELRGYLAGLLPDYMVPSYFVQLEELPLTVNGKVDRRALPAPGFQREGTTYAPPGNQIELKLTEIWADILLGNSDLHTSIGIDDDFFQLGGHSLKATALVSNIYKEFDVKVPLGEIFRIPTIRELAAAIAAEEKNTYKEIHPVEKKEYYPLSSAQKRMFVLHQLKGDDISDNAAGVMLVEGDLDKKPLEKTVRKLIERHELLRTSFEIVQNQSVQRVHEHVDFEIQCFEAEEIEVEDIIETFIRPFDLGKAPIFRLGLVKLAEKKHVLMYDMHHIIIDGKSQGIFIKDFVYLYNGIKLPELNIQYKDFSSWQNELIRSDAVKKQEEYWLSVFSGDIPELDMPTDYPRPPVQSFEGDYVEFEFSRDLSANIHDLALKSGASLFMVLLAIYNILLSRCCGQETIVVGSPIAGRLHPDLENIFGFFVNTLAILNRSTEDKTFRQFLEEVKYNSLKAYENQNYQFEDLVEKLGIRRDSSRSLLFDTMFVFQNAFENPFKHQQEGQKGKTGLIFKPYKFKEKITQFDIIVHAFEMNGIIGFKLRYCTKLFKPDTIERFIDYYKEIAGTVVNDTGRLLKDIKLTHRLLATNSNAQQDEEGDFEF